MFVEVFRSRNYVVFLVRDEKEMVVGIMAARLIEFIRSKDAVSDEIANFLLNVGVLPPTRIVFHRNDERLFNFVAETFIKAERKLEAKILDIKKSVQM